jgi:hypothetical protein
MTDAKALPKDLIDSLSSNYKTPEDLICEHWAFAQIPAQTNFYALYYD